MINYVELIKNLIMPLVIHEDCVNVTSTVLEDGTIISPEIDDMFPFLEREEYERIKKWLNKV